MPLDDFDRTLLNHLQKDFPLEARPFAGLAARLRTSENDALEHVRRVKELGLVRFIGPVVYARRLGYQSTLVAMKVAPTDMVRAERAITAHPGVSHAYERTHDFNVWLTLAVPPGADIDAEVDRLGRCAGAAQAFSLPATRMFKIGVFFDMTGDGDHLPATPLADITERAELSSLDRRVLNTIQQDLPMTSDPFAPLAAESGVGVEDFLAAVRSLHERGVIRRFGAAVNHHQAGFAANVMSCWAIYPEQIEKAAATVAALREVSHCYERRTNSFWRYNLFAMVHGHHRDECEAVVARIAAETGVPDNARLYTIRELKKTRVKYAV